MSQSFGAAGGVARAQTPAFAVPLVAGLLCTVSTYGLLAPVAFAKISGPATLSINPSTGGISTTAATTAGAVQTFGGTVTGADGVVIPFTAALTGAVVIVAPDAPTFTLTSASGQITIVWVDGQTGGAAITAHKLYRGTVTGGAIFVGTIVTGSPYIDSGLTNGTSYFYRLSAVNSAGEGALGIEASAAPSNAPAMPAGAAGLWVAADYVASPRRTVPNRAVSGVAFDPNLMSAPRRMFNQAPYYTLLGGGGNTYVDANTAAPDGSNDASTVTAAGTANWRILCAVASSLAVPTGQYTLCVSARVVSGSGSFLLGEFNQGPTAQTATGTWQRFTKTFTYASGNMWPVISGPATPIAGQLELCDFQMYAGSADLNAAWATAAPLALQSSDMKIGITQFDASSTVSGGWIVNGGVKLAQMVSALNLSKYSVVYLARPVAAGVGGATYQPIVTTAEADFRQFSVGFMSNRLGSYYSGTAMGIAFTGTFASPATQSFSDLWKHNSDGPFCGADVYDGATYRTYRNGQIIMKGPNALAPPTVKSLGFGYINGAFQSGIDLGAFAIFPNVVLTGAQVVAAQSALVSAASTPLTTTTTVAFFGTSITAGASGESYAYLYASHATKPIQGFNAGALGAPLSAITGFINTYLAELAAYPYPAQNIIFSLEAGANDLLTINSAATTTFTNGVAAICDTIRSAGYKVILHTVLSRDDSPANTANFNANRAQHNAVIRSWVGTHADAICDIAADATIGTDTSADNTTYFNTDKIHPLVLTYTTIWEPLIRPILNSLI